MKGQRADYAGSNEVGYNARRSRALGRVAFWTGGSLLLAFVAGFGIFSTYVSTMMAPTAQRDADAIIVLTGGQSRIDAAIDLLKSGKGKRLLISGVNPVAGLEDLRRATGADASLFSCCVDIDHAALDTIGNAEEGTRWLQANAFASVILVTNNYHMPRSMLEMRRIGKSVEILPYPVVNARLDNGEWLTRPDALRVLFTEYTKFLASFARGLFPGLMPEQAERQDEAVAGR